MKLEVLQMTMTVQGAGGGTHLDPSLLKLYEVLKVQRENVDEMQELVKYINEKYDIDTSDFWKPLNLFFRDLSRDIETYLDDNPQEDKLCELIDRIDRLSKCSINTAHCLRSLYQEVEDEDDFVLIEKTN
jgi:hypothetical protein